MNLIKRRQAKNSNRGIYIQDKELLETVFKPGTSFRYIIDITNHKLIILSTEDLNTSNLLKSGKSNRQINTVSKRKLKNLIKPVIDIRSNTALSAFKGCDYLQVSILEDKVIVEGFTKANESTVERATNAVARNIKKITSKVSKIQDIIKVKKQAEIAMSLSDMDKQVVGLDTASSISEWEDWFEQKFVQANATTKRKLKHIDIPLKVVSLFSGAGMMDKAFVDENFDVVFALEMNESACETYKKNINDKICCGDITKIDKETIPKTPIIIGGSPCQGFSNSNRITHYLDNPKNLLVREFIDTVKKNKDCKVFVLENVPQILTAGNGLFKEEIYEALSDFEITSGIMAAPEYKSPQDRKRAIFIGSKIGKINLPSPIVDAAHYATVRDAFRGLDDSIPNQLDVSKAKDLTLERIKYVPMGGNVFDIPENIRPDGKHSDFYKRLSWDKPSITIVNPRKSVILHPEENRILSVRECARLFGLSDDFVFYGSLADKQQQVANGVPYHISKAIAIAIKNAISAFSRNLQIVPFSI